MAPRQIVDAETCSSVWWVWPQEMLCPWVRLSGGHRGVKDLGPEAGPDLRFRVGARAV